MKLLVERLGDEPSTHHFETGSGWWEGRLGAKDDALSTGAIAFDLEARLVGSDLHLAGSVSLPVDAQCSRCLKRYGAPLADTFRVVLEPATERTLLEPEAAQALARDGMSLGDEFETGWYRGPEIRLEAFLAEVVSLALPLQTLCREDCAGLCSHCGVDRNEVQCECEDLKPSSPFAVLAALREG